MDTLDLTQISSQTRAAVSELITAAALQPGQLLVVGCSTSEVKGAKIGSGGSEAVAEVLFDVLTEVCAAHQLRLAIQCCEHLNRALVVERQTSLEYRLEPVTVIPVPKAGGALAARAMQQFTDAVVVEEIAAHAGLDIGNTLIGMHLKKVAVPVRLTQNYIGQACLTAARTRPKLIGGNRAVYE